MRELQEYDKEFGAPQIDASLLAKRRFVEEFFTTGELAVAYIRTIDSDAPRARARELAQILVETDRFVRDLMGLARKNVIGSITGLLAEHTSILAELRDEARADGKFAPAIAAEIARGKALGLYDRANSNFAKEKDPTEMTNEDLSGLLEAVSRLPAKERQNIAKMLSTDPAGGLLTEEEIEGDFVDVTPEDDD